MAFLPTDDNGMLAAVDSPGAPPSVPTQGLSRPPMGPPQEALQSLNFPPLPGPQPPTPQIAEPPSPMQQVAQKMGLPAAATMPGAGSNDLDIEQQRLQQHMSELKQQQKFVQDQIKAMMNPDALKGGLQNGGKVKPSDLLSDALYNFSQLNLRNPIYGSLKGEPYKPIQQQRMENALQQHNAQLQNLTLMDKSLNEQMVSDQYMSNQARQEAMQRDKVDQFETTNQLARDKYLQQVKHQDTVDEYGKATALVKQGLMKQQTALTALRTNNPDLFKSGNAEFTGMWIQAHKNDPDFKTEYTQLVKDLAVIREQDKSALMFSPNPDGSMTAIQIKPGMTAPAGSITPQAASSMVTPTMQTRSMVEIAPTVRFTAKQILSKLDGVEGQLGPLSTRWTEFAQGKLGDTGPVFQAMLQDEDLLQTALMRMHTGSRGSDTMLDHFGQRLHSGLLNGTNLRAVIKEIQDYADEVEKKNPVGVAARTAMEEKTRKPSIAPPPPPKKAPPLGKNAGPQGTTEEIVP